MSEKFKTLDLAIEGRGGLEKSNYIGPFVVEDKSP